MAATPANIVLGGKNVDFSNRFGSSNTVVGSPAAASETVVCQVTGLGGDVPVFTGVFLSGCASFTVGTNGTAVRLRLRTGTAAGAGTVVADTGALTGGITAANLVSQDLQGLDTAVTGGGVPGTTSYCLTLTVTAGSAASTVSQTNLTVIIF